MMPASQLSPDDLRNVRQALVMHNSLDILSAIKHLRPDLTGLDVFFRSAFLELQNLSREKTCVL